MVTNLSYARVGQDSRGDIIMLSPDEFFYWQEGRMSLIRRGSRYCWVKKVSADTYNIRAIFDTFESFTRWFNGS